MIRTFADADTARVFARSWSRRFSPDLQRAAWKKLAIIHAAGSIQDMRVPPGNRLQKLSGAREGQHSLRVNDQWRICFVWRDGGAHEVEIADYH